tara:strand:- start:5225 stop:6028 length:804 start_codon:yes stop_codon:yes gene_type:complete
MKNKKVLIISSEVTPYLPQTNQALNSYQIPKSVNDNGGQTRIFMPKYGLINERRHQLHEVIRLSGMNLVIDDEDMPLIIKVASIPKERMQVYFIDNDEYFKRRGTLRDEKDKLFKDNDERMIFFTKGVIETVKKLNWSPDIIHLHGWFTSLFPLYLKTYYKDEPLFAESKIVTSVYSKDFDGLLSKTIQKKVSFDQIPSEEIQLLKTANYENLIQLSLNHSDGYVVADDGALNKIEKLIKSKDIPVMDFDQTKEDKAFVSYYSNKIF